MCVCVCVCFDGGVYVWCVCVGLLQRGGGMFVEPLMLFLSGRDPSGCRGTLIVIIFQFALARSLASRPN